MLPTRRQLARLKNSMRQRISADLQGYIATEQTQLSYPYLVGVTSGLKPVKSVHLLAKHACRRIRMPVCPSPLRSYAASLPMDIGKLDIPLPFRFRPRQ